MMIRLLRSRPPWSFALSLFAKKPSSPSQQRLDLLNEQFQQYKKEKFSRIARPQASKANFVSQQDVDKQHRETKKEIDAFAKEYKFNRKFDTERFIKLISQVSYTYDNQPIVRSPEFQKLLTEIAEQSYQFTNTRHMCLLMNFCNMHDVNLPVWTNFAQYIRNFHPLLSNDDKLLVLSTTNQFNKEEFLPFFELFETSFLKEIKSADSGLRLLHRVLEVYRAYDQGSDTFFFTIKDNIIKAIPDTRLPELIQLLMYFALSTREQSSDKKTLLEAIMLHLFKTIRFLSNKELLQVFYAYVKTGLGTPVLYGLVADRLKLLLSEMSLGEMEAVLTIAANEPTQCQQIFSYAEIALKPKIIQCASKDLVQITVLFLEQGLGTKDFLAALENHIVPSMHTVPIEELADLIWAISNTRTPSNLRWIEKAATAVIDRVEEISLKSLAQIVWLTSDYIKSLRKPQESKLIEMFEKLEVRLISLLEDYKSLTLKDCALVLSAYVQNIPIPLQALHLIYDFLIEHPSLTELDGWDLATIVWGFSYIEDYDQQELTALMNTLYPHVLEKLEEMRLYEMLMTLRAFIVTKTEQQALVEMGIEKCLYWVDMMNSLDQVYLGIYVFASTRFKNLKNQGLLLKKLIERAQRLKALDDEALRKGKELAEVERSAREYLVREEVERIKATK